MDNEDVVPFTVIWVQLEMIMLSEVSRKEKDKYHLIRHILGI